MVPASLTDQNLSRLGPSVLAMDMVVICRELVELDCDAGQDTGLDRRNPSFDCWAVGLSPLTILSSTKVQ